MDRFRMADVISVLGIEYPPSGKSSYYVQCPCCDDKPRSKHLNINLKKEVFRCPKCGVSGGIFDLYALFTGTPRDKVRDALIARLGIPGNMRRPQKTVEPASEIHEYPMANIEIRHAVYDALLSCLTLAPDHKKNLLERGLSEREIVRLGYRTTPIVGMSAVAKKLISEGYDLSGVPGFYRDQAGAWAFVSEKRGILIPVRDMRGRIQGLQIRRDDVQKRKFRWVSSADKPDGCRAMGWTHLAGPVRPTLILTEGPMKGDIVHALSGLSVLAVPGVNALTTLKESLTELRKEGLCEIKTAFDMDFLTNPNVQNGYRNLLALLDEMGFRYGTYLWDPRYKGLDDYIWAMRRDSSSVQDHFLA